MLDGKVKNVACIRLLAALSVVFSHSFLIAESTEDNEPLQRITGEVLGIYGVFVFFIVSGYFVTRSCLLSTSPGHYLWKRFLRIYPAYGVSLLITILLIAPLLSGLSFSDLNGISNFWPTVVRNLLIPADVLMIDGVELYQSSGDSDLGIVLNPVYWTIKIEIILYLFVLFLCAFKLLNRWVTLMLCITSTVLFSLEWYSTVPHWGLLFGMPGFFAGSFLYLFMKDKEYTMNLSVAFLVLTMIAGCLGMAPKLFPVLVAYPVIALGFTKSRDLDKPLRSIDLSYGIYVFGWPIQQSLRAICGDGMSGWSFFAMSVPPILAASAISWFLIEKPSLSLKSRFQTRAE